MGILDTLIYGYRKVLHTGGEAVQRDTLKLGSGFTVVDNEETGATEVSVTVVSGSAEPFIAGEDISAADVVCAATTDGRVVIATPANLARAGNAVGVATASAASSSQVGVAGPGDVVDLFLGAPTSGKPTPVIINASAAAELKDVPSAGDFILGIADGTTGFVTIDPKPPAHGHINPQHPLYGAVGDLSVGDSDAIRLAVDAGIQSVSGLNYAAETVQFGRGAYKIDKPIHIKGAGQHVRGVRNGTVLWNTTYAGPVLAVVPDIGELPRTAGVFGSGGNDHAMILESGTGFRHTLPLSFAGGGMRVDGQATLWINLGVKFTDLSTAGSDAIIVGSFGVRGASDDAPYPYDGPVTTLESAFAIAVDSTGNLGGSITTENGRFAVATGPGGVTTGVVYHVWLAYDGSTLKLYVNGSLVDTNSSITGAISQRPWESVRIGYGSNISFDGRSDPWNSADCLLAYLHLMKAAPSSFASPSAKPVEDASKTQFLCTFDTVDDIFVKGRTRAHAAGAGILVDAWFVHHYNDINHYVIVDVQIEDLQIVSQYGQCIVGDSALALHVRRVDSDLCQSGIVLFNNCYLAEISDCRMVGSENSNGGCYGTGIMLGAACYNVLLSHLQLVAFGLGIVCQANGQFTHTGKGYLVQCRLPVFLFETLNCEFSTQLSISDEAAHTIPGYVYWPAIVASGCKNLLIRGQLNYVDTGADAPLVQVLGPASNSAIKVHLDNVQMGAITTVPGWFDVFGLDPAAGDEILVTASNLISTVSNPLFTPGSDYEAPLTILDRELSGKVSVSLSGTTQTLTREEWVDHEIDFTGSLSADCTVTVPKMPGVSRIAKNGTTGGYNVLLKASGSSADLVILPPGARAIVTSDGTDLHATTSTPGVVSGVIAGTTTSATTADQTVASINLPTGRSVVLTVRVREIVGTSQAEAGQVVATYLWNGSAFANAGPTSGIPTDLSTNTLDPKLTLSSGVVSVKVTPVSASSASHKITYELDAA